jgi:PTH1 family peptidyl-tRNA hydrolase
VVALLARRHGGRLKPAKRERSLVGEVDVDGRRLALAFPQTYMNDSGLAVAPLARRFGVTEDLSRLVIVHDELDLPVGRLQVKLGGGLAGHNGLKSIKAHLHSDAFARVRIGIGKPPGRQQGTDHVLKAPGRREQQELAVVIEEAADAVECILAAGVAPCQNRFNR